jgi:hypothetical protein
MFIAMNRFQVKKGSEADFEAVWLNWEIQITKEPGFGKHLVSLSITHKCLNLCELCHHKNLEANESLVIPC